MLEREVEAYLGKRVKKLGGRSYKWVSPGTSGVPDRIVVLPGGRVIFIELKAPGQKPRPLQVEQMRRLSELGCEVMVLDSKEAINKALGV